MNEATKKLFELAETSRCYDEYADYSTLFEKIKALVDAGADINARNESGFNVLQIILEVKSPELSLTSTICGESGDYCYGCVAPWYIDGCLRNGFQCSKDELTELLLVFVGEDHYFDNGGDFRLICTLLELGADWNCQDEKGFSLLAAIAGGTSQNINEEDIIDWRYEMLCAYYNAGGDLYVKNKAGKYVWQCCSLPLTATAFLLEHGIDIDNDFGRVLDEIEDSAYYSATETYNKRWILTLDTYNGINTPLTEHPTDFCRYKNVINILLDNEAKYQEIPEIFTRMLPGFFAIDNTAEIKQDFYKPTEIYLQLVKEKYGDLKKVIDKVIESCRKDEFYDIGEFFSFVLPLYPEITEYFPWEKLSQRAWRCLLYKYPEFADRCNLWGTIEDDDIEAWDSLICEQPEIMNYVPLEKFNACLWVSILLYHPHFADKCDKWNEISKKDWDDLLRVHPQFADKCPFKEKLNK